MGIAKTLRWFWTACLLVSLTIAFACRSSDLDVTQFGAVADGSTDSTEAIQDAIDAAEEAGGGRVAFPAAERPFLISRGLVIRSSAVELAGLGATILLADNAPIDDQTPMLLAKGSAGHAIRDVRIQGLTFDANFFAQPRQNRPRGIEFRFVEGARVTDVTVTRVYVGLDFGRGCVDGEARGVTITDYAEDAFDASGDADEFSGGTSRDIRFIDVVARDAPRADSGGNAFEIEDGAQGVLIENALVENVAGNGFGLRNHNKPGKQNHSRDVELRNVTIRSIGGEFAGFGRCAPREQADDNSYHEIQLVRVRAEAPVVFFGPIRGLKLAGGTYGDILLGLAKTGDEASPEIALDEARVEDLHAHSIRINGTAGRVTLSRVTTEKGSESISIEGAGGVIRIDP